MAKIKVSKYGSTESRDQGKDGILIGEATSWDSFIQLFRQGVSAYFRYEDENGKRLDYGQVSSRFGITTYPSRPKYDSEEE